MTELTVLQPTPLATSAAAADRAAAAAIFADYQSRKSAQTLRRQAADLALFAQYLTAQGLAVDPAALGRTPAAWAGLTWGRLDGFVKWMVNQGYSVGSLNVRLSTVKTYATLASLAGVIPPADLALLKAVRGYSRTEAKRMDERRLAANRPTRLGRKKAAPILLTRQQAAELKNQPDTPQGRRDALMVCLMLEQGLRVGEVQRLQVGDFDLTARQLVFYRPKVDKTQTHALTQETYRAAAAYLAHDAPAQGSLLRGSRKNGELTEAGIAVQKLTARIRYLGEQIGVAGLSAHDLRHTWATTAARNGTPIDRLQEAGGWSNPITPLTRYIEPAQIANEGVRLA